MDARFFTVWLARRQLNTCEGACLAPSALWHHTPHAAPGKPHRGLSRERGLKNAGESLCYGNSLDLLAPWAGPQDPGSPTQITLCGPLCCVRKMWVSFSVSAGERARLREPLRSVGVEGHRRAFAEQLWPPVALWLWRSACWTSVSSRGKRAQGCLLLQTSSFLRMGLLNYLPAAVVLVINELFLRIWGLRVTDKGPFLGPQSRECGSGRADSEHRRVAGRQGGLSASGWGCCPWACSRVGVKTPRLQVSRCLGKTGARSRAWDAVLFPVSPLS